ncbi:MAG: hypothetical protein ACOC1J_00435 [Prolixibacteraceae bacterium]
MKAIEVKAKTDDQGLLRINVPLQKNNQEVRLIILFHQEDEETEIK